MRKYSEKNKQLKRVLAIFVITVVIYIVIGSIPRIRGKNVSANRVITVTHPNRNGYYRLAVEKDVTYSFYMSVPYPYKNPPKFSIRLFTHGFKIAGVQDGYVVFTARHNGYYYATIANSKGGVYRIHLHKYPQEEITRKCYVNLWKSALIMSIGILSFTGIYISLRGHENNPVLMYRIKSFLKLYHPTQKIRYKPTRFICAQCGVALNNYSKFCEICGLVLSKPADPT